MDLPNQFESCKVNSKWHHEQPKGLARVVCKMHM